MIFCIIFNKNLNIHSVNGRENPFLFVKRAYSSSFEIILLDQSKNNVKFILSTISVDKWPDRISGILHTSGVGKTEESD